MLKKTTVAISEVNRSHYSTNGRVLNNDQVVVEEPLQICLVWHQDDQELEEILTITMRTPGDDFNLATGLLQAEGIIRSATDIDSFELEKNQLQITLKSGLLPDLDTLNRRQISQSSCGICGKTSLLAIEINHPPAMPEVAHFLNPLMVQHLPQTLRQHQPLFEQCGGIHGAALFNKSGQLIHCAEDVGRHNALDKLLGHQLNQQKTPDGTEMILLSGRASFELVQKTVMAGYAVLMAVGAPSSLAIKAAQRFNLTLIGFVNNESMNVYTGEWRIKKAHHGE